MSSLKKGVEKMVCGLDFDYPNLLYRTATILALLGDMMFIVFIFIYTTASNAAVTIKNYLRTISISVIIKLIKKAFWFYLDK